MEQDTTVTIRIPSSLLSEVNKMASRRTLDALSTRITTRSEVIRNAIADYVKREAKKG